MLQCFTIHNEGNLELLTVGKDQLTVLNFEIDLKYKMERAKITDLAESKLFQTCLIRSGLGRFSTNNKIA